MCACMRACVRVCVCVCVQWCDGYECRNGIIGLLVPSYGVSASKGVANLKYFTAIFCGQFILSIELLD